MQTIKLMFIKLCKQFVNIIIMITIIFIISLLHTECNKVETVL